MQRRYQGADREREQGDPLVAGADVAASSSHAAGDVKNQIKYQQTALNSEEIDDAPNTRSCSGNPDVLDLVSQAESFAITG